MNNKQKRAIAEKALRDHPDMSNRGLAELAGVSEGLFRAIRKTRPHTPEAKRTGIDGKDYPLPSRPKSTAVRDREGNPIPPRSAASITWREFAPIAEITEPVKTAFHRQRRRLKEAQDADDFISEGRLMPEVRDLETAYKALRRSAPYALCPKCRGGGCDTCNLRGMVSELTWKTYSEK